MKPRVAMIVIFFFFAAVLTLPTAVPAQDDANPCPQCTPDEERCAELIKFGKQALWRGKYQQAKQFFRKAIHADPTSEPAWQAYDLSTIHALGDKVESNLGLIRLDESAKEEAEARLKGEEPPEPGPQEQEEKKDEEEEEDAGSDFEIIQDEGC